MSSLFAIGKQLFIIWRLNETSLGYYSFIFASSTFLAICFSSGHVTLLGRRTSKAKLSIRFKYSLRLLINFFSLNCIRLFLLLLFVGLSSFFHPSLLIYIFSVICALPVILSSFTITLARFNLNPAVFSIFYFTRAVAIFIVVYSCLLLDTPVYILLFAEFSLYFFSFFLLLFLSRFYSSFINLIRIHWQSFINNLSNLRFPHYPALVSSSINDARNYGLSDVMSSTMPYIDKLFVKQLFGIEALGFYTILSYPIMLSSMISSIVIQIIQPRLYRSRLSEGKKTLVFSFILYSLVLLILNIIYFASPFEIHPSLSQVKENPSAMILVTLICFALFYPIINIFLVSRKDSKSIVRSSIICLLAFFSTLSLGFILHPSLSIYIVLLSLAVAYLSQLLFLFLRVSFSKS